MHAQKQLDLSGLHAAIKVQLNKQQQKRIPTPRTPDKWPPNYDQINQWRALKRSQFRENPILVQSAKNYYRTHPIEFINEWCSTYDPRNASRGKATVMPFILFERQVKLVKFLLACLTGEVSGLVEKSRDMGATWVCSAVSVWLWLFHPQVSVGWGSRKGWLVDRLSDPDSIFEKLRMLIRELPVEFMPIGFDEKEHLLFMRIINPENGSTITGEAGDNIGRGGRKLIYFKDESAHYEHAEKIEAALADNTRCQIDISSVSGLGTVFHRKRESAVEWEEGMAVQPDRTYLFVLDWADHPDKSEEWHDSRRRKAQNDGLMHVFAREVERDYAGAVEGTVIPIEWVRASIGAAEKLGFDDSGMWVAALDVADAGLDRNALCLRKGSCLKDLREWGDRDTGATTREAVKLCAPNVPMTLQYDCIGVGAGVKAEANRLRQEGLAPPQLQFVPWNAGATVLNPFGRVVEGDKQSPLNRDFYQNLKAQAWWELRRRFEKTYRAINEPDFTWEADELISIPPDLSLLRSLEKELVRPTACQSSRMKLMIDKTPDGMKSPNLADAVVMAFWPWSEWRGVLRAFSAPVFVRGD